MGDEPEIPPESLKKRIENLIKENNNLKKENEDLKKIVADKDKEVENYKTLYTSTPRNGVLNLFKGFFPSTHETEVDETHSEVDETELTNSKLDVDFESVDPIDALGFGNIILNEDLLKGLKSYGFEEPTEIQNKILLECSSGDHAIIQGYIGSGKTFGSVIHLLQRINTNTRECQAIFIGSNHVEKYIQDLGSYMNVSTYALSGNYRDDVINLRTNVHVLVGSLSLVYSVMEHLTNSIKIVICDNFDDVLLSSGFDTFQKIFTHMIYSKFITLSTYLDRNFILRKLPGLSHIPFISLPVNLAFENAKHLYAVVEDSKDGTFSVKTESFMNLIYRICDSIDFKNAIMFYDREYPFYFYSIQLKKLETKGCNIAEWEPRKSDQNGQAAVTRSSRTGKKQLFVIGNYEYSGPGVIPEVSVIINFTLPSNLEQYSRRIAWGLNYNCKNGTIINIVNARSDGSTSSKHADMEILKKIRNFYNIKIDQM